MPIKIVKRYSREEIMDDLETLYIFGDNLARVGMGGQAFSARGCPNAVGIPTLISPSQPASDASYWRLRASIFCAFVKIKRHLKAGGTVVWPEDGVGTGIADLKNNCPRLLSHIQNQICELIDKYGEVK
jgi:hypothetical protein